MGPTPRRPDRLTSRPSGGGPRRGAPLDFYTVRAPAKVNLHLNVLGARPDGYHEIDTIMQTVDLTDELQFRRRPEGGSRTFSGFTLSVWGRTDGVPTGESNLVMKAARLLERHTRSERASLDATGIRLHKRIPPGAGLGGGSSDAASTLVGLTRLWGLHLAEDDLLTLAAELGSDVPFFIRGGTARCTGRGEQVQPLRVVGELHLVLVFSGLLSTAEIYELWDRPGLTTHHPGGKLPNGYDSPLDLDALARCPVRNSLEEAAFAACPGLRDLKQELLDAGAGAAGVSGSGSCVFGTADSPAQAGRIVEVLSVRGREAVAVSSVGPRDL